MLKLKINLRLAVLCAFSVVMASSQIGRPERASAQAADQCTVADAIQAEATEGTVLAGYPTLAAAFQAVNAGTHRGQITLKVCADTTETQSAALNPGDTAPAAYTSLLLRPAANAPRTISANLAGSPLIDLNGADNVTIDGINENGHSLTISNTSTATSNNTSTIRFVNDSTNNVIENVTILGSSKGVLTAVSGTVYFGLGLINGSGNSNNTIRNSSIGSGSGGEASKAIFSQGTQSSPNRDNAINGNQIYDYHLAGGSVGLILGSYNTEWVITGNRFYQSSVRSISGVHEAIRIGGSAGPGSGFEIADNVIGYSNASSSGTYSINSTSASGRFTGIHIMSAGTSIPTRIDGNTIAGIRHLGSASGHTNTPAFAGIAVTSASASVKIGGTEGNIIGSVTVPSSIEFATSAGAETDVHGILAGSINCSEIVGNVIAGFSVSAPSAELRFWGIRMASASISADVKGNIIGSSNAGILIDAPTGSSGFRGIDIERGGIVDGNRVRNVSLNTAYTFGDPATIGIRIANGASSPDVISGNTVTDVSNTSIGSSAVQVRGIFYSGLTTGNVLIDRNQVSNINLASTNNAATVHGIGFNNGNGTVRNNMVVVGSNMARGTINGIGITTGTAHAYHNSVYVGGTASLGTSQTFALHSNASTSRNYRNNILVNARTNSGSTGKHYALRTSTSNANLLISNHNILLSSGLIGLQGTNDRATLTDWQTATGQDLNSFSEDPKFVAPDAAVPDLHIQPNSGSIIDGNGFDVGVLQDFDGQLRSSLTPVDIGADAGNFAVSTGNPGTLNFPQAEYTVDEATGMVGLTIERSGGSDGAVAASFQIDDGTATGGATCSVGVDMINTGGVVEFADGETSKLLQIEICNDDLYEGDESFSVSIAGPTGGATIGKIGSVVVEIADDDEQPVISFNYDSYQQAEGREVVLTVARTGSLAASASAVWTAEGLTAVGSECGTSSADFWPLSGSVNFAAGEDAAEIRIMLCGDGLREDPAETFTVTLESAEGAVIGAGGDALVAILDAATEFEAAGPGAVAVGGVGASYPSELLVAGRGMMAGVRATLFGVTHDAPERLDVLVVSPVGSAFVLMAAAGGSFASADGVLTFEDAAAGHLADDGPIAAGVNHRPTACDAVADLPLPAPAGPYYLPGCGVGGAAETLGSAFGGTEANGVWRLFVRDRGTGTAAVGKARAQGGGGSIAGWGLQILAPTQAGVSVAGRVTDAGGRGIANAAVTISGGGFLAVARTNAFGFYVFDAVPAGFAYTVSPSARGRTFTNAPRVIVLNDDVTGLDFAATP